MNRFIFALGAALLLAGCGPMLGVTAATTSIPPAPSALADETRLDEQAALAVELAYQASALAASTAIDTGLLSPETRARIAARDRTAYRAVRAVRAAYDAGNADSYLAALNIARAEVTALLSLARRSP